MFGSNWPVCLMAGECRRIKAALEFCLTDLSASERAAVMGGSAIEAYRLKDSFPLAGRIGSRRAAAPLPACALGNCRRRSGGHDCDKRVAACEIRARRFDLFLSVSRLQRGDDRPPAVNRRSSRCKTPALAGRRRFCLHCLQRSILLNTTKVAEWDRDHGRWRCGLPLLGARGARRMSCRLRGPRACDAALGRLLASQPSSGSLATTGSCHDPFRESARRRRR